MEHTDILDLFKDPKKFIGKNVKVCGWVRTSSEVKPMTFIQLNDGTTSLRNLQLTINADSYSQDEYKDKIKPALSIGTSL